MRSTAIRSLLIGALITSGALSSACHKTGGDNALDGDPFATKSSAKEDQFGKGFGRAFRAPPNATPVNVSEGDLTPVSRTAEPIPLN